MYDDIVVGEKGNRETCVANSLIDADYARKFAQGHWSFLGPGSEKRWCGTHVYKPNGDWDDVAFLMINFSESGHPVCRGSSAFERGDLKSKGKRKIVHTFQWQRQNSRNDSSYSYFRQSAQCLRSSSGNV